jgi:NAD(P)-dependent dehydrogenase (short-subunit alcohol dehydrogenase family)
MKEFENKTVVVTGAASGIGLALAKRMAREKMNVVLADVEISALKKVEAEIRDSGSKVTSVITDVSKEGDVKRLAGITFDSYGAVDLLINNAGVGIEKNIWNYTTADWKWVLGVNLWGVIHGIRTFVPMMMEQESRGHIINTASMAGLFTGSTGAVYKVSKHGVVVLSEILYHELQMEKANIGVSVICPGFIKTRFMDSDRNRPPELINAKDEAADQHENDAARYRNKFVRKNIDAGIDPDELAETVIGHIREEKFYIFVNPDYFMRIVKLRMEDILDGQNPTNPMSLFKS